jgi:hypothetical protein
VLKGSKRSVEKKRRREENKMSTIYTKKEKFKSRSHSHLQTTTKGVAEER